MRQPRRQVWQPTIVRSCELGFIKRWDAQPPEAPFIHYSVLRHSDRARTNVATYQEAMDFITDRHCPILDLYQEEAHA